MHSSLPWNIRVKREIYSQTFPRLPRALRSRIPLPAYRWDHRESHNIAIHGEGDVRCLIAPASFAGQGYFWSHAISAQPGVSSVNLRFMDEGRKIFGPTDFEVDSRIGRYSPQWARHQLSELREHFTHVLLEPAIPLLGGITSGTLEEDVELLASAGLEVALVAHGSEVRIPSVHRELELHSPFWSDQDGYTSSAEARTRALNASMDRLGLPEFVSTPDLLNYRPNATWLPLTTYVSPWMDMEPISPSAKPRVLHISSGVRFFKGSDAIDRAMLQLHSEGLIDYSRPGRLLYRDVPAAVKKADIVVNQVGMGGYGVMSLESMLAGRPVVAQTSDSFRSYVRSHTGREIPIVEATPDNLVDVVRNLAEDPDRMKRVGEESRAYALDVHSSERVRGAASGFLDRGDL